MLTKKDLREIIQSELKSVKDDIAKLRNNDIKQIIQSELKTVKQDITKIRKDINMITGYFDEEYLNLRKRVERIEEHLNLSPIN